MVILTSPVVSDNEIGATFRTIGIEDKVSLKESQVESLSAEKLTLSEKSVWGEILFFLTGQKEIMDALKYLNENLPASDIALPFFSALNSQYRNMIEKIDKVSNEMILQ